MIADTTGGTTIGNSTKPTSSAANRGRNIQMPRLNTAPAAVAITLLTIPMRRLSSRIALQPGGIVEQRR